MSNQNLGWHYNPETSGNCKSRRKTLDLNKKEILKGRFLAVISWKKKYFYSSYTRVIQCSHEHIPSYHHFLQKTYLIVVEADSNFSETLFAA